MYICEHPNCQKEHSGSYGSGRFCSSKCARSYSTKDDKGKSKLIICPNCGEEFEVCKRSIIKICGECKIKNKKKALKRNFCVLRRCKNCEVPCKNVFCSKSCQIKFQWKDENYRKNVIKGFNRPRAIETRGGPRAGGGKSKVFEYKSSFAGLVKLNKEEIKVAKYLDSKRYKWIRNLQGFQYISEDGLSRKFYPDFYLLDFDIYLEFKGFVRQEHLFKHQAALNNNKNLNLLIVVGEDKRYRKYGIQINEISRVLSDKSSTLGSKPKGQGALP